MPYYRLDPDVMTDDRLIAALENGGASSILEDPETGHILAFTENNLAVENGMEKCTEKIFNKTVRKIEKSIKHSADDAPLPGMSSLEESGDWIVRPYSNRRAMLGIFIVLAGVKVMRVGFGGGRGDTMYIGREIVIPENAGRVGFRAYANADIKESVSLAIVLTTENERPWLETKTVKITSGSWQDIRFDLSKLKKEKLARVTKLNLAISSDIDKGYLLVDNLFISG
jgi:hypothetical protein